MTPEQRLTQAYAEAHPLELARELERLAPEAAVNVLQPLSAAAVAGVMEHLLPPHNALLLRQLAPEQAVGALRALPVAPAIAALRRLPAEQRAAMLERLDERLVVRLERALAYPDETAGALADPFVLALPEHIRAGEALEHVRAQAASATYYVYTIGSGARLSGVATLKELLAAPPGTPLVEAGTARVSHVSAEAGLEELLQTPLWDRFHMLPVLDRAGVFVGALRLRTLRRAEAARRTVQDPGSLSDALLRLWELYAMAGIGIMTRVADAMAAGFAAPERTDAPRGEGD